MSKPEIVSEAPISLVHLKAELEKIKKRDGELNFRSQRTEEYLTQFVTLSEKQADDLFGKIQKLDIPRLKDTHIYKIIDMMPKTVEDLKAILQAYTITVKQENLKKIVDLVTESAGKA
jgi:DNA-directed RNA polymerase subunit F